MEYKACCNIRCCLGGCKIAEKGGCKCACDIHDTIESLKAIIDGKEIVWGMGSIFIPDIQKRQACIDNMDLEEKKKYIYYRDILAPEMLKQAIEDFKAYCKIKETSRMYSNV